MKKIILVSFVTLLSIQVFAWGGRGHDTICEAAVFQVKEPGLKKFLSSRPHIMGHLCNIPDILWRNIGEKGKIDAGSHYIEPEFIGSTLKDISSDYQKVTSEYVGKKNHKGEIIKSIHDEIGSSWWRIDQLSRQATEFGKNLTTTKPPQSKFDEQDEKNNYNKLVLNMMTYMGVMGHYVGDASMPFHNVGDYDGYAVGHGGIHSFYEDYCVSFLPPTLWNDIYKSAQNGKNKKLSEPNSVIEKMRAFSIISNSEVEKVIKLDVIQTKSIFSEAAGNRTKTPAVRENTEKTCAKFKPLIIEQMGRSVYMLAHFWDQIYIQAGKPDLSKYKSYAFPFQPEVIPHDYLK